MSALLCLLLLAQAPGAAEEPWLGLSGSGTLTLSGAATAAPGRFAAALAVDNRDRDPLGIDIFDARADFTLGVRPRLELFGHLTFSRVVALPEVPAQPPPPLDLILPEGVAAPARPWYALYFETPYVNHRGDARFSEFVPGDALLAAKLRLADQRGRRPAFALALELRPPLSRDRHALQSGSGSGGFDAGLRAIGEWRSGRWTLLANAAYTLIGAPPDGDRVLSAGARSVSVVDEPLRLPDRLDLGLAARRELGARVAAVLESKLQLAVGGRTKVADEAAPLDFLAGVQGRFGHARVVLGLRYHGHSLPSGEVRPATLAGFVDLTDVGDDDARSYLTAIGLGGAAGQLRSGVQRAVKPPRPGVPLPAGARVIPDSYAIRSEHQLGSVLLLGWRF
jgi:hypothetical protein